MLTCRWAFAVLLAMGASIPAAQAADDKPLSPKEVVEKKVQGEATVEFEVAEAHLRVSGRDDL